MMGISAIIGLVLQLFTQFLPAGLGDLLSALLGLFGGAG